MGGYAGRLRGRLCYEDASGVSSKGRGSMLRGRFEKDVSGKEVLPSIHRRWNL